jgi:hypothetical protein
LKNIAAGKFSSVKKEKFKEEIWVELFLVNLTLPEIVVFVFCTVIVLHIWSGEL